MWIGFFLFELGLLAQFIVWARDVTTIREMFDFCLIVKCRAYSVIMMTLAFMCGPARLSQM